MTRVVRVKAWRRIRKADDDDDEITVFVQFICLMIPFLFPPLTCSSCEGGLFFTLFFYLSSHWPG